MGCLDQTLLSEPLLPMKVNVLRLRSVPGDGSTTRQLDVVVWPSSMIKLQPQSHTHVINGNIGLIQLCGSVNSCNKLNSSQQLLPLITFLCTKGNIIISSVFLGMYYFAVRGQWQLFRAVKLWGTKAGGRGTGDLLADIQHSTTPTNTITTTLLSGFILCSLYFSLPWPLIVMLCKIWILANLVSPLFCLHTPPEFFFFFFFGC